MDSHQGARKELRISTARPAQEAPVDSSYARAILEAIRHAGWRGVLMHFRGCSGVPNRRPRRHHAGDTEDFRFFLEAHCGIREGTPVAAVGFSIGGNVLLKYLGERGSQSGLTTAVAVSVPFDLQDASHAISQGFSRFYEFHLLQSMRASVRAKFSAADAPFDYQRALTARRFIEFDDLVTAPLHGFANVHDYYRRASCRPYLRHIETPTLIVHATDDPFMTPAAVPVARSSSSITGALSRHVASSSSTTW